MKKRKEPLGGSRKDRATHSKVSPKRDRLDELKRKTESAPPTPVIAGEPALSEGNTLRYRIDNDFNECIVRTHRGYGRAELDDTLRNRIVHGRGGELLPNAGTNRAIPRSQPPDSE